MKRQTSKGIGVPLANARPETKTDGKITVSSATITPNSAIPQKHTEYADGVSPELSWTAVPNAKSYAIIMEDPEGELVGTYQQKTPPQR